ncbi:interleukin-23 subunit alpha-like [Polypterus senegalus]|nr:interleukin-23 subunit alpha-like [Polypterus senegalus]
MIAQMQDVKVKVIMMDGVPYIESADRCDPAGLRSNSKLCLSKISAILQTYIGLFEKMGGSCDWDNSDLKEEMLYLQKHLKARGINESGKKMGAVQAWMCHSLPQALLQRLTSFSSIVARVFAPGDPAKHTEDDNSFLGCGLQ